MTPHDQATLEELRTRIRQAVRSALGPATTRVALLDLPRHRNLGDSLIALGALAVLADLGVEVVHVSDLRTYARAEVEALPPDVVLVFNGGGNLGDLHPQHDEHRREVIGHFPDRAMVMLPQTIHVANPSWSERAIADYARATNLTVLLRDQASLAQADALLPAARVAHCPDLALMATLTPGTALDEDPLLVVARNDNEVRLEESTVQAPDWRFSWPNRAAYAGSLVPGRLDLELARVVTHRPDWLRRLVRSSALTSLGLNERALADLFAGRRAVATNRLHVHVTAVLLGIPHWVCDNNYGKIDRIFHEYTGGFSTAHWAPDLATAIESARAFAAAGSPGSTAEGSPLVETDPH